MTLGLQRRQIGPAGPNVFPVGVGTAAAALEYGAPSSARPAPPRAQASAMLEQALRHGVDFVDTAPAYGEGEAIVGQATAGSACVVATKLAHPARGWAALDRSETLRQVRESVAASLHRLRKARLDAVQIHNAEAEVLARGDLVWALETLRDEGFVQQLGATVYGERNALAVVNSGHFDSVQVAYSALDRRVEMRVLPAANEHGVGVIVRSILMRGVLGPAGRQLPGPYAALSGAADRFRSEIGASWEQLPGAALAWALLREGVACVLIGPRTTQELVGLLEGAERYLPLVGARPETDAAELPDDLLNPSRWQEITL